MSPIAAGLLLDAVERTPVPEDRLTELLAHTLQMDPLFRNPFCALFGVRAFAHAEIRTQRRLSTGRRVDLEVILREAGDIHAVWVEVKAGAGEQPNQLVDYAGALDELYPGRNSLVALAPTGDEIFNSAQSLRPSGAMLATSVEWQTVVNALDAVGRKRNGRAPHHVLVAA